MEFLAIPSSFLRTHAASVGSATCVQRSLDGPPTLDFVKLERFISREIRIRIDHDEEVDVDLVVRRIIELIRSLTPCVLRTRDRALCEILGSQLRPIALWPVRP